ncbi:MAG TPA: sigma factor, partial [Candidatus Paceibacterota bacterium]|nr:sigma factor [Candidatus Paceibacterota bacterium]
METNDHIDARLAVAATRGDDAALRRLFERYIGPVHSFVRRFVGSSDDAEDITQQSFVNVWKHLDRYDPS